MTEPFPLVGVSADVREAEQYRWHAAPDTYLKALTRISNAAPVILPALSGEHDASALLARLDGLLLTGAASNVHPSAYQVEATDAHAPFDRDRDALTAILIRTALERGVPLLCVCRGHQELNVALGGSITPEVHALPGRADHRAPSSERPQAERYAIRQTVTVRENGRLAEITGAGPIRVNTLHRQGIDRLADGLDIEAEAEDGTIEAVSVRNASAFALGVQWHPEYWAETDPPSRAIFEAFGKACRAHGRRKGAEAA